LVPFRLLFNGVSEDPKTVPVEKIDFQINTIDLGQRTEFLKLATWFRRPNTSWSSSNQMEEERNLGIEEEVPN
jgi:hypothetical protein